jgi:hypothetical protein
MGKARLVSSKNETLIESVLRRKFVPRLGNMRRVGMRGGLVGGDTR